jgi:hypothetical protein
MRANAACWSVQEKQMRVIAAVMALGLLAGCGLDPEYRAARMAERDAADMEQCRRFGAEPGTPAFVQCRTMLHQQAMQASQAQGRALQAVGAQLMNPPRQQIRQQTNCTTTRFGNQLQTRCW